MHEYSYIDERPYEIINGTKVLMSPLPSKRHSIVSGNIHIIFGSYLKGKRCRVYKEDTYIRLDKIRNIPLPENNKKDRLIPDVMVVCNRDIDKDDGVYGAPDLVVEVLSPSTAKNDRNVKKDIYETIGVREYWIISPQDRFVEVYLLKDGKYSLDNIYHAYSADEVETIMDDETIPDKTIVTEFKTSLYDDLIIQIGDVFDKLI